MLSTDEKDRLLGQFDRDPPSPLSALSKCAAGILALVVVAAGPWLVLTAGGPNSYGQAAQRDVPQAGAVISPSLAESKRVFDERRRNYEEVRLSNAQSVNRSAASSRVNIE